VIWTEYSTTQTPTTAASQGTQTTHEKSKQTKTTHVQRSQSTEGGQPRSDHPYELERKGGDKSLVLLAVYALLVVLLITLAVAGALFISGYYLNRRTPKPTQPLDIRVL